MIRIAIALLIVFAISLTSACSMTPSDAPESGATPDSDTCDDSGINALFFVDDNVGWAVGECGTILKTTDGAETRFLFPL